MTFERNEIEHKSVKTVFTTERIVMLIPAEHLADGVPFESVLQKVSGFVYGIGALTKFWSKPV